LKILLYSDVHGNLEALWAVLEDAEKRGFDAAFCLGDTVGYGADPEECVKIVSGLSRGSTVLGNHDAAIVDPLERGYLNTAAQAGVRYSMANLTPESVEYLKSLPLRIESDHGFVASHGSPNKPEEWIYILDSMEVREAFQVMTRPLAFIGHTHYLAVHNGEGRMNAILPGKPIALRPGDKCIVNVGSVGQPRDADSRAAYVVFDDAAQVVEGFRVEYDVDAAARKIVEAGLPAILADRIRHGY
jgi:diadenosine tetraphosphatase ApaH/serine/threonine PP2A family protein phosphatase